MMQFYYVKRDLFGIPAGRVERFSTTKAGPLVIDGSLIPYDEKRHGGKPGSESVPDDQRISSGKCPTCGK
jgi:hypothetical protein